MHLAWTRTWAAVSCRNVRGAAEIWVSRGSVAYVENWKDRHGSSICVPRRCQEDSDEIRKRRVVGKDGRKDTKLMN